MNRGHLLAAMSVLLCSIASGAARPAAATSESKAREQLQRQDYPGALKNAEEAARTSPDSYLALTYVALAYLGMERFEEADAAASRALARAPAAATPSIDILRSAIARRGGYQRDLRLADSAMAEGLFGKAARLYEQVWRLGNLHPEAGLKAARLYIDQLDQQLDGVRLLRSVAAQAPGTQQAAEAEQNLLALAPIMRRLAEAHVKAAVQQDGLEAAQTLQKAEDADPTLAEIYILRAQLAAAGTDMEALQSAIKAMARRNVADPTALAALPNMQSWLDKPKFDDFLADLMGAKRSLIRQAVKERRQAESTKLEQTEEADWSMAVESRRIGALEGYLKAYPAGRFVTEARLKQDQWARRPPRPELPIALPEAVWQQLETSEAYQSARVSRWMMLNLDYETEMVVGNDKGFKSRTRTSNTWAPVSEKCVRRTTVSTTASMPAHTTHTYFCAGIELMTLDQSGKVTWSVVALRAAHRPASLQPGSIVAYDHTTRVPSANKDIVVNTRCTVRERIAAAQLHPQLPGDAWVLLCDSGNGNYRDYFVDSIGLYGSAFGILDVAKKDIVVPVSGARYVSEHKSFLDPDVRTTTVYLDVQLLVQNHGFGLLGVNIRDIPKDHPYARSGASGGVDVQHVVANRPAAQAGLQKDDVIVKLNGVRLDTSQAFREMVSRTAPGSTVVLTVWRAGALIVKEALVGQ